MIRMLIADDQPLFREGLRRVLGNEGDFEIVAEAGDGREAVAQAEATRPDVALLDVRMPKMNGVDAARAICDSLPDTLVLMLTVSDEDNDVFEAVKAGAVGYLLKDVSVHEVADTARAIVRGERLVPPPLAARVLAALPHPMLTDEEERVIKLVAKSQTPTAVAATIGVDVDEVHRLLRSALAKLHTAAPR